jgi:hypothetical protein
VRPKRCESKLDHTWMYRKPFRHKSRFWARAWNFC